MTTIGTFTATDTGFTGTLRTLTLDVKVKLVATEKTSDSSPDYRLHTAGSEIGAAWKKVSKGKRPYVQVMLDDPSFAAAVYANLIEGEDGNHTLIWSRTKGK